MKHVIIGAGAAGLSAAREIRARDAAAEIVVVSKDDAPHSRCMLHRFLSGERDAKGLAFVEDDFFTANRIELKTSTEVKTIDAKAKKITTDGGEIAYDKLLIATGSVFGIPPIPHFREAKNVYGFRDLIDAEKISAAVGRLGGERSVFIVGAGLVGLDVAYALIERGVHVTIAEMADRILPLQADATAARAYQDLFERAGAVFKLGIGASDSTVDADGSITAVKLSNGEEIKCGFVICAAGVRPNVAFLDGSGIKIDRGIVVDETMRTSEADIYAAGDVTALAGIWPNARDMGRAAGASMSGTATKYEDRYCTKNTINFFGLAMLSVGEIEPKDASSQVYARECRDRYEKAIVRDGVVTGIQLQGNIAHSGHWQQLIKEKIDVSKILARKRSVFDIGYGDLYKLKADGEYSY